MSLSRRTFIKISTGTLAAYAVRLDSRNTTKICVTGHVYDLFGFPVANASVSFVTGYSLKADDGLHITSTLKGPVITDNLGAFRLCLINPHSDVAIRVSFQNEVQQITVAQITGTNIPFYNAEVWSPDHTKWINDLNNQGLLTNINIFLDASRQNLLQYFTRKYNPLLFALQHNQSAGQDGETAWEGDHMNPNHPNDCLNGDCDNHYGYPQVLVRSRKINPPWGRQRGVIPFVCAEGVVFTATPSGEDGDIDWEATIEPHYGYLTNPDNAGRFQPPRNLILHCEMCEWFRGKTNIGFSSDAEPFANKRVWMTGTWSVDNGHAHWNELHPVYWIAGFVGGWRRFVAAETVRISGPNTGAQTLINEELSTNPQSLLNVLGATFGLALLSKNLQGRSLAQAFYVDTLIHLNKFGLNCAFPNEAHSAANSINPADFLRQAATFSTDQMTRDVKNRYQVFFKHLTSLGSAVFVFPSILFVREGTEMIKKADALGLTRPSALVTVFDTSIPVSLGNEVLRFADSIVENGPTLLKLSYQDIFTQMKNAQKVTAAQIADYYATTSVRLISYGMYADSNTQHSRFYNDHYNWALPRAKVDTAELINSVNVRIDDLFRDAFPFARIT